MDRLERDLRRRHADPGTRRWRWVPRPTIGVRWAYPAIACLTVLAIVGAIAYGMRDSWTRSRNAPDFGAAIPAASPDNGTPVVGENVWPTAAEIMAGCPVERRPEGSVEAMLAATTVLPTISMPTDQSAYPIFVQSSEISYNRAPVPEVDALNGLLASLFACNVRDMQQGLMSPNLDGAIVDNSYFANFTDDFLRRWFGVSGFTSLPKSVNEPTLGRSMNGRPPLVTLAMDIPASDEPRVRAYVSAPNAPVAGTGWLVEFVQIDGVWKIDEFALAVLDTAPTLVDWPTSGTAVTELFLFDKGQNDMAQGNVAMLMPDGGPVYSGDGLVLRVYNFGTLAYRVVFQELNLDITIEPGTVLTTTVDADPGTYRMLVYQGDKVSGQGSMFFTFLAPGTIFEGHG